MARTLWLVSQAVVLFAAGAPSAAAVHRMRSDRPAAAAPAASESLAHVSDASKIS
jgi:hypothetical protein